MAPGPITPDEEQQIRTLHAQDIACKEIARRLGRSPSTISKAAKRLGLLFDRARTQQATQAKRVDAKARRAQLSLDLLDDAARLRRRLWQPSVQVFPSGKGPARVTLDLPPAKDARDFVLAVHTAIRGHADLERLDSDTGADAARSMLGQLGEALQVAADQLHGADEDG